MDYHRGVDAVHFAPKFYVHEDELRKEIPRELDGLRSADGVADDLVSQGVQTVLDIERDDALVLDEKDSFFLRVGSVRIREKI